MVGRGRLDAEGAALSEAARPPCSPARATSILSRRMVLAGLAASVPVPGVAATSLCDAGGFVAPCPVNFVAEGDSITFGMGSSGTGHRYPDVVMGRLPPTWQVALNDIATSGIAASTIDTSYPTRAGAALVPGAFNLLTLLAGTNDGAGSNCNAVYRSLRSIVDKARRTGYDRILIATLTSRGNVGPRKSLFTTVDNSFDADALPLNRLIRNGWRTELGADGLIDFAACPAFATAAAATDTTYYTDQLHMTDVGYALMGAIAAPVVQATLIAAGAAPKPYPPVR